MSASIPPTTRSFVSNLKASSSARSKNRVRGGRRPLWDEPDVVDDRTIYRRPDAVPLRPGGARPVQAEIVDGVPVYRIYRPRHARTGPG